MGKAQRESEQRAVEGLVRKLQGGDKPASVPVQPATPARPAVALPAPPKPPAVPPVVAAPKVPDQPVESVPKEPDEKPASPPSVAAPAPAHPPVAPEPEVAEPVPPTPSPEPRLPAPPQRPTVAAPSPASPAPPSSPTAKPSVDEADVATQLPSVDIEVYFSSGSARITPRAIAILTPLGNALSDKRLANATFMIAGHTDAVGSADYNRELSRRRAEAVRRFLVERFGIDASRLVSRGFGFDRLKSPDSPLAAENRRVQIVNWTSQVPR